MGRRKPRPMAAAVEQARSRLAPQGGLAAIQLRWKDVVGPAIAAVAEPVSEKQGVLRVECSEAVWVEELTMMESDLLARLREQLGPSAPQAIKFVLKRQ